MCRCGRLLAGAGKGPPQALQGLAAFPIGDGLGHPAKRSLLLTVNGMDFEGAPLGLRRRLGLQLPTDINNRQLGQMPVYPDEQVGLDVLEMVHPGGILDVEPQGLPAKEGGRGQTGNLGADDGGPVLQQTKQSPLSGPLLGRVDPGKNSSQGGQVAFLVAGSCFLFHSQDHLNLNRRERQPVHRKSLSAARGSFLELYPIPGQQPAVFIGSRCD